MTRWLSQEERAAWVALAAVLERLPGLLESQLRGDSGLTHFEYWVLAMLSESPGRARRTSDLAQLTSATLPRLSHVVTRLEARGLLTRAACPHDGRATDITLTPLGWRTVVAAAPGHVENVRRHVIDPLTPQQVGQLTDIAVRILERIAPDAVTAVQRVIEAPTRTTAARVRRRQT